MAQTIINLTGMGGLADNFWGDDDRTIPTPQNLTNVQEGQLASGLFNPYLRKGYLSPLVSNSEDMTTSQSVTNILRAVEHDQNNNTVYWTDGVKTIFKGDSLNDTSLTKDFDIEDSAYTNRDWSDIHDLQMYELNGVPHLYMTGKGMPVNSGPLYPLFNLATSRLYRTTTVSFLPSGATKPILSASARFYNASNVQVIQQAISIPAVSNTVLVVFFYISTGSINQVRLWDGSTYYNLTGVITSSTNPRFGAFFLENPASGTNFVVAEASTNQEGLFLHAAVLKDTSGYEINTRVDTSPTIQANMEFTDPNAYQLHSTRIIAETGLPSDTEQFATLQEGNHPAATSGGFDALLRYSDTFDGVGLQVGVYDLTTDTREDLSWLTTVAQGGFLQELKTNNSFMRVADNGFAYLFADNAVHKIDGTVTGGTTGAVTKNVMLFPDYFRITDAVDYRSSFFIGLHQYPIDTSVINKDTFNAKCGIFVWDRISTEFSRSDYIELPGVREIKKIYASPDGVVKLLTVSSSGLSELRQFGYNDSGGVVFPVVKQLGYGGHPQFPDGLTLMSDKAVWLANNGRLYSEKQNVVNILHQFKAPGDTFDLNVSNITSGAIFYGANESTSSNGFRTYKERLTTSYKDGTHQLKRIYPMDLTLSSNGAQTVVQGDVYTGVQYIPIGSNVESLRIYNLPVSGSGEDIIATVKVYFNQGTTATHPNGITKSITKNEARRGYVDFKINSQNIHAVQVEIEWNPTTTLGTDTYHPSVAIVNYQQTSKRSPDNE